MPSTFAAARDFARGTGGSRMAQSLYQSADDLAPSYFKPGEVSPGAALVKFAQLFLTQGARMRREREADAFVQSERQRQQLTLDKLERESAPGYESPSLIETKRHNRVVEDRLANPPAKTATPRALVTLGADFGQWKKGAQVDPQDPAVRAELQRQRIEQTARHRVNRGNELAEAKFNIAQIDASSKRAQDAAEDQARLQFTALLRDANGPTGSLARSSARSMLGLTNNSDIDPITNSAWVNQARADWIARARRQAATIHEQKYGGQRARYQRTIDSTLPDENVDVADPLGVLGDEPAADDADR